MRDPRPGVQLRVARTSMTRPRRRHIVPCTSTPTYDTTRLTSVPASMRVEISSEWRRVVCSRYSRGPGAVILTSPIDR
jgi:hypothetical protein